MNKELGRSKRHESRGYKTKKIASEPINPFNINKFNTNSVVTSMKKIIFCLSVFLLIGAALISEIFASEERIETTPEGYRYAVRVMEGYNKNQNYPALFCFHHSGDGIEMTRLFSYASYQLNWLVVGFMDTKNGPWEPIVAAQESVLNDIQKKYNIDKNRLYTAGFSGAARMAYALAYKHPDQFKGVIACGAGFGLEEPSSWVAVYMIVGEDDCNIAEVKKAYTKLGYIGAKRNLFVFKGGHEMPGKEIINQALDWISKF